MVVSSVSVLLLKFHTDICQSHNHTDSCCTAPVRASSDPALLSAGYTSWPMLGRV